MRWWVFAFLGLVVLVALAGALEKQPAAHIMLGAKPWVQSCKAAWPFCLRRLNRFSTSCRIDRTVISIT